MARRRIYGILADYKDQNDHDTLRSDPAFKLVCDRLPSGLDQPTGLARKSHRRLRRVRGARRTTEAAVPENRNKELKRELAADRLSDHRFLAHFFRLELHAAAEITVSARRVLVRLSASWPFADEYRRLSQAPLAPGQVSISNQGATVTPSSGWPCNGSWRFPSSTAMSRTP